MNIISTPSQAVTVNSLSMLSAAEIASNNKLNTPTVLDNNEVRAYDIKALENRLAGIESGLSILAAESTLTLERSIRDVRLDVATIPTSGQEVTVLRMVVTNQNITNKTIDFYIEIIRNTVIGWQRVLSTQTFNYNMAGFSITPVMGNLAAITQYSVLFQNIGGDIPAMRINIGLGENKTIIVKPNNQVSVEFQMGTFLNMGGITATSRFYFNFDFLHNSGI